jgi:glycosyltransferase involved in cell wall biosynthesis
LTGATLLHRAVGIWARGVDLFVAPSEFTRGRLVAAGLEPGRLVVKPNFVDPDPGVRTSPGRYGLYVGRLSESKGVGTLLQAWRELDIPLKIAGEGPMAGEVEELARQQSPEKFEYLGRLSRTQVFRALHGARFLVFPSRSYECCPLTILEAFACGVPVVASGLGAAAELLADGECGWQFTAGDPKQLASAAKRAWHDLEAGRRLGARARHRFEERFSARPAYRDLLAVYGRVVRGAEPALIERLPEASVASG